MKLTCIRGRTQEYEDTDTGRRYWSWSEVGRVLYPNAYDGASPDVLDRASRRGRRAHLLFAGMVAHFTKRDRTGAERPHGLRPLPPRPDDELGPYYDSMLKWCELTKPQAAKIEAKAVCKDQPLAGQPDLLAWLTVAGRLTLVLIDLKSGMPLPTHTTQKNVYHHLEGYEGAEYLMTLYAQKDGSMARGALDRPSSGEWAWALAGLGVLKGRQARGI